MHPPRRPRRVFVRCVAQRKAHARCALGAIVGMQHSAPRDESAVTCVHAPRVVVEARGSFLRRRGLAVGPASPVTGLFLLALIPPDTASEPSVCATRHSDP